jgi:hypothetical protein
VGLRVIVLLSDARGFTAARGATTCGATARGGGSGGGGAGGGGGAAEENGARARVTVGPVVARSVLGVRLGAAACAATVAAAERALGRREASASGAVGIE